MLAYLRQRISRFGRTLAHALDRRLIAATKPAAPVLVVGTLADLVRGKPALIAENALLRQQLLILQRSVARPRCTSVDRAFLVVLASRVRLWRQALLIVQPETVLRWHRQGFRLFWRGKSRPASSSKPKVADETIALIREMAAANRSWGAERIRGELLKLHIHVAKTTIQRYMRQARPPRRSGQTWTTFLHNHAAAIWACDFLPVTDLLFRPLYAFFIVEVASRRVMRVGVTRHPTDAWVAQQLREATPFGIAPRYLIRDNDSKFGPVFARVAQTSWDRRIAHRLSSAKNERDLRALPWKYPARVPRSPPDPWRGSPTARPTRVHPVLQRCTPASRYPAADSYAVWARSRTARAGNRTSHSYPGWFTSRLSTRGVSC